MISISDFNISITDSIELLKKLKLFKGKGVKPHGCHTDEFIKTSKKNRHTDMYSTAIRNLDYEIILYDQSIFQFSRCDDFLRYAFIQNPNIFVNKRDYIESIYSKEELSRLTEDEITDLESSINEEEYEQFLNDQEINLESHFIRYDLDIKNYDPYIHPYSHIHIGLNENVRLSCKIEPAPINFILFVIKNTYCHYLKAFLLKNPEFINDIKGIKCKYYPLPKDNWIDIDEHNFYFI